MTNKIFILSLVFVFFIIFVQTINSQTNEDKYSLKEIINIAYQSNPQLTSNEKNIQSKLKQIDYLDLNYYPQLFWDLSMSFWNYLPPNKLKLLDSSLVDIYTDVRVTQLLFDWNKNSLQKEYVHNSVYIEKNNERKIKQTISYLIAKNYFELIRAKRTVQIHDEVINQLKEHLKIAEALYGIGKVSNLDVIKANVQIEIAIDDLEKSKNQYMLYKNNLNALCGNNLKDTFDIVDNVDELWVKYINNNYNIDELKKQIKNTHPDLQIINIQTQLKNKEIQIYNSEIFPSIYAFGIINVEDSRLSADNLNWNIGVTLSYSLPFFQGANYKVNIDKTKINIEALNESKTAVMQQIEANVKNNLIKFNDIKSRLSSNEKIIKLAEESLITANLKYGIGKGSNLDVLDAETVLKTAKLNYNQIVIDFLLTVVELNYNIGSDSFAFN